MIAITLGGSGLNAWAKPSGFAEASKAQFGAMPGLVWDRATERYEGPEEALRLVVSRLEAAGVSIVRGGFEAPIVLAEAEAPGAHPAARDYQSDGISWIRSMLQRTAT